MTNTDIFATLGVNTISGNNSKAHLGLLSTPSKPIPAIFFVHVVGEYFMK